MVGSARHRPWNSPNQPAADCTGTSGQLSTAPKQIKPPSPTTDPSATAGTMNTTAQADARAVASSAEAVPSSAAADPSGSAAPSGRSVQVVAAAAATGQDAVTYAQRR